MNKCFLSSLLIRLLLFSFIAQAQDKPLRLPLLPVPSEDIELDDFFWYDAIRAAKLIDSTAVPVVCILTEKDARRFADLYKQWQKRLPRLSLAGGMGTAVPLTDSHVASSIETVINAHRLALLTGNASYIDVLERALYNGVYAGLSPSLKNKKLHSQVARTVHSATSYMYAFQGTDFYVNLFIESTVRVQTSDLRLSMQQSTSAPWENISLLTFRFDTPNQRMRLHVRLPSWASHPSFWLNEEKLRLNPQNGYIVIDRLWNNGDVVHFNTLMKIVRVKGTNTSQLVLQRGQLLYGVYGNVPAGYFFVPDEPLHVAYEQDKLSMVIAGDFHRQGSDEVLPCQSVPYGVALRNDFPFTFNFTPNSESR